MKLSGHAKFKLERYNVEASEIIKECKNPVYEFYDGEEQSNIKIIKLKKILFAVVLNSESKIIITVYTTDRKTIQNRKKNKRWI